MGVAHFLLQDKENEIGRAEGNKEKGKEIQALISQESWAVALPPGSPVSLSALQKTLEVPTTPPASPGAGTRLAKEEARGELFWKVRTS